MMHAYRRGLSRRNCCVWLVFGHAAERAASKAQETQVKPARPVIEVTTTVMLRCSEPGSYRTTIRHATVIVGSGVRTELEYELPSRTAVGVERPWRIKIDPASLPMLRSWQGGSLSEQRLADLSLRLDSGELGPGALISGATEYRLPEFPAGVSVVLEFTQLRVGGSDC